MKPISNTAFYTCGVRMHDADNPNSVCGDAFAKDFMTEKGLQVFESLKEDKNANLSILARHRAIDDFLRQEIAADPQLRVILIGAGFDSRAFRFKGGAWVEIDEPQVIAHKNERLPAGNCDNRLERIPIDFATESLEDKLSAFAGDAPVVFVVEGVLMYLEREEIKRLLQTLNRLFPNHKLIADMMDSKFLKKYGDSLHEKLSGIGASFLFNPDKPDRIFLENGYRLLDKTSIMGKAVELKLIRIPGILLKTVLRTLANGNAVYVFQAQ